MSPESLWRPGASKQEASWRGEPGGPARATGFAQSSSRAGGGAEWVWSHIWGAWAAGGGQTSSICRGWGWNPFERPIKSPNSRTFFSLCTRSYLALTCDRTGTPLPRPSICLPSPPRHIRSHFCRAEPVPPAYFQCLAARANSSFLALLLYIFPGVPRIQAPSAFCLVSFPPSFLSLYLYFPPSM